jgi:hypothetical protein
LVFLKNSPKYSNPISVVKNISGGCSHQAQQITATKSTKSSFYFGCAAKSLEKIDLVTGDFYDRWI